MGSQVYSVVLSRFGHIEAIPDDTTKWGMSANRARRLAENLEAHKEQALLYRRLTTLRSDVPLKASLDDLKWHGAREELRQLCLALGADDLPDRIPRWIPEP